MLRVGAVTPLYPPGSRVGAWLSTHECLRALVARGHRVSVSSYLAKPCRYRLDGVSVHGSRFAMPAVLRRNVDVVVSHAGDDGYAHRWALEHDVPSIVMVHGTPTADTRARFKAAPPTVTVANAAATVRLCDWPGPFEIVHPPVWPSEHATTPGDRVTLVNLSPDKGGRVLSQIARRMPHVEFLAVRGSYGPQQKIERANVETIAATHDMRGDVWSRTRVLLMPSRVETWGRVAIEAAASGIPTIAAPTPGLREALGDAGTFVPARDVRGWVAAIARLRDADEWAQASARALARSVELDPAKDLARFVEIVEGACR
jgi:glycosyltransferase involved in cell wall biosynthesis